MINRQPIIQYALASFLIGMSFFAFISFQQARRIGYVWLQNSLMSYSVENPILVYADWDQLQDQDRTFFQEIVAGSPKDAQDFYTNYFLTYNIVHEAFHGLRALYGLCSITNRQPELLYEEESIVNILAIAYWKEKNPQLILELEYSLSSILSRLLDPTPAQSTPQEHILHQNGGNEFDPRVYGYYQFSMVLDAIQLQLSLKEALVTYLGRPYSESGSNQVSRLQDASPTPERVLENFLQDMTLLGYSIPNIRIVNQYFPYIQFILVSY